jgi:hypothetical protein
MQTQVALNKVQQIPVKALADHLEFLLSHVEGAPQSWREEMLGRLGVIEDTFAVALDKTGGAFSSADNDRVALAIGRIVELIDAELEQATPD